MLTVAVLRGVEVFELGMGHFLIGDARIRKIELTGAASSQNLE